MYNYCGKNILVLGTGVSGQGVAKALTKLKANVILNDQKKIDETLPLVKEMESLGVRVITGIQNESLLEGVDRVVISPGIPPSIPLVEAAKKRAIPVIGEVEVAYDISKAPILGITGTNGKTTTTMLLGKVLEACHVPVMIGGNIGASLSEQALKVEQNGYLVAELSSYQLETIQDFKPKGAIFLNLTPDHLHRHKTMDAYLHAKMNITKNQGPEDILIVNADDQYALQVAKESKGKILWISTKQSVHDGAYYDGKILWSVINGEKTPVIMRDELPLRGDHNVENALAVIALIRSLEMPITSIRKGLIAFRAVEHRIEPVLKLDGVWYFNDSKATNTDAVIKALTSFTEPLIILVGGHDKGEDLSSFMTLLKKRAKFIVFMGEAAPRFIEAAQAANIEDFCLAHSMQEAIDLARCNAVPGDVVLLSPACSSFDWYTCFEERGNDFKEKVMALVGGDTSK